MTELQDSRERASRHAHPKGVAKQVIQTWSVMGEAFDLESRYKVIDYLGTSSVPPNYSHQIIVADEV